MGVNVREDGEPSAGEAGSVQDVGGWDWRRGCLESCQYFLVGLKSTAFEFDSVGFYSGNVIDEVELGRGVTADDEAVDDVTTDALASFVAVGAGHGGVKEAKASQFDWEGSDGGRWRLSGKEGQDKSGDGLLNVGECIWGARQDSLQKLPSHLKRFL
ncbi:MAG TPA: hypothetical protein V6D20_15025 [Candidatus Obscuribacterales bacterium]